MADFVTRYAADHGALRRFHPHTAAPGAQRALRAFFADSRAALGRVDFPALDQTGRVDYVLLRSRISRDERALALAARQWSEAAPLVPFAPSLLALFERRQRVDPLDAEEAARELSALARDLTTSLPRRATAAGVKKTVANRAAGFTGELRKSLEAWFKFYDGYDPQFSWWVGAPYKDASAALDRYATYLREELVGVRRDDRDTIVGDPVGRDATVESLAGELIPYTPEELIEIANREFAWCEREMLRASRDAGFGDDWRKALEHVKTRYVAPGAQPALVKQLAIEADEYVTRNNLVTVPPLARDTWRMIMMTPQRQRINPFFTGGETISVSFPVAAMTDEQKRMSLRGNNRHFARATVFHEMIPGHHLQQFMTQRYLPYRKLFSTPFWIEGWALYWEMVLWDRGFTSTPEDRIGALFWRMFRCARIIFSLRFHLEQMTAPEAVEFLVNRVGHERENAMAEVRRSVEDSSYDPLYQAADMLGGLQIRALRQELVDSRRMTERDFHDAILRLNAIPIELVRASLTNAALAPGHRAAWRFYDLSRRQSQ